MGVMMAATLTSMVMWAGSGMTEPVPIFVIMVRTSGLAMMLRGGPIMPIGGVTSAAGWCNLIVVFCQGNPWQHVHICCS